MGAVGRSGLKKVSEPQTWHWVLHGGAHERRIALLRFQAHRRYRMLITFALVVFLAGIAVIGYPLCYQAVTQYEQTRQAAYQTHVVNTWPYPRALRAIQAAEAYNRRLARSGQHIIGVQSDPFSSAPGVSTANNTDTASAGDREYMSLLNEGHGVMGSVSIPKISLVLPIYHGTSSAVLLKGAGHLYGTSLPVGGKSTHAVITGHTGMVGALMFTRIDELRKGDPFYITSMGREIGYRVDSIRIIEPTDFSHLLIVPGQDRVTLMTCYPYGVNTQRLLVSGHRANIPKQIPSSKNAGPDLVIVTAAVLLALLLALIIANSILRHRHRWWPQHHGAEWKC